MTNLRSLGLVFVCTNAFAATTVPMKECANCNATQMHDMAKNRPLGMAYIYDLGHHAIRKYEIYMDSTCRPSAPPVASAPTGQGQSKDARGGHGTECGSVRAADEMLPVDANVQTIFDHRYAIYQLHPSIAAQGTAGYSGPMPDDSLTGQPFDLRQVAWDYPTGSYMRFKSWIQTTVNDRSNANNFIPGLGDMIQDVDKPGSTPQPVKDPNGNVVTATINPDPIVSPLHLSLCTPDNDCALWDVPVVNGQVGTVQFNGVFGAENQLYPSGSNQNPNGGPVWNWRNRGDLDHFRSGLTSIGWDIPGAPTCGSSHWQLTVARVNGVFDSAWWTCGPP
jgi:hypothetical protein